MIPFWHEILYALKARPDGGSLLQIPINSYGHCNFTKNQVLVGFGLMLLRSTGERVNGIPDLPSPEDVQRSFEQTERDQADSIPPG